MKAMIIADFYLARQDIKKMMLGCTLLGFIACLIVGPLPQIMYYFGIIIPLSVYTRLAQSDEGGSWENFRLSLPLTRRHVIAGRYAALALLAVTSIALGALVCFAAAGLEQLIPSLASTMRHPQALTGQAVALNMGGAFAVIMLALSIMLPIVATWGMKQAMMLAPAALMLGGFSILQIVARPGFDANGVIPFASQLDALLQSLQGTLFVAVGVALAALALYAVSAMIAAAAYRRRDF